MEFYIPLEGNNYLKRSERQKDQVLHDVVKKFDLTFYQVSRLDKNQLEVLNPTEDALYIFVDFNYESFQFLKLALNDETNQFLHGFLEQKKHIIECESLEDFQNMPISKELVDAFIKELHEAEQKAPDAEAGKKKYFNELYRRIKATNEYIRYEVEVEDENGAARLKYHKIYTTRPEPSIEKWLQHTLYILVHELYSNVWPLFINYKLNIAQFVRDLNVMNGFKALAQGAGFLASPVIILIRLAIVPFNVLYYLALTIFVAKKKSNEPFNGEELFSEFHRNFYVTNDHVCGSYPVLNRKENSPKLIKFTLFTPQSRGLQDVDSYLSNSFKAEPPQLDDKTSKIPI